MNDETQTAGALGSTEGLGHTPPMTADGFFAEAKRLNLRMLGTPEEIRAALDAKDAEIEVLCGKLARTREQTVLAFAKFLHSLPAEEGWDVGPARVKFNAHGALEGGPLWATQEDTERWARAFLQGPNVELSGPR